MPLLKDPVLDQTNIQINWMFLLHPSASEQTHGQVSSSFSLFTSFWCGERSQALLGMAWKKKGIALLENSDWKGKREGDWTQDCSDAAAASQSRRVADISHPGSKQWVLAAD